jgi:pyruvate dehydrogenase E1 component alpha subunit
MQRSDSVVVDFFGDGASNRGDFHEALNMAALYRAPVVLVCENNLYGQTVAARSAMAIGDIADRAIGYGMPGHIVDGQDVLAVFEATQAAVARARKGEGPTLLECKTYRFLAHYPIFEEDRPPEEISAWLDRDPLAIHGDRLKEEGLLDDATIGAMDETILRELEEAIQQAEETLPPDPEGVFASIYAAPVGEGGR